MQYQYAFIGIAMFGTASGLTVSNTTNPTGTTLISGIWPVDRDYYCLVEGGFVVDLRPLNDTPNVTQWVNFSPSGKLDNGELSYLDTNAQAYANALIGFLKRQTDSITMPEILIEEILIDLPQLYGGFASAMFYALAWESRGALIGMRQGNNINWSDGTVYAIPVY